MATEASDVPAATTASIDKFYIMAMAATGKSTFANRHGNYKGYRVVDFADELPPQTLTTKVLMLVSRFIPPMRRAVRRRPDLADRFRQAYFDKAFAFMDACDEPLVLLGRRTRSNFRDLGVHDRVRFAMVLIDKERHRSQVANRKKNMRNFLPFMHHWTTDFDKIQRLREEMRAYADKFEVPVFETFEAAIDALHHQYGGAANDE